MTQLQSLFGDGTELSASQMICRAIVIFIVALMLIRIAGRRSFGMHSAFDNVITLLLGAVLSRAVVGASPFVPTIAAAGVIVLLHRAFAWFAVRSHAFGVLIKGDPIPVFAEGAVISKNLYRSLMSRRDLAEEVRVRLNRDSFAGIDRVYVERNGALGIVLGDAQPPSSPE
jgi:uncharacterized membrane protein YcaP (DUF421 family)